MSAVWLDPEPARPGKESASTGGSAGVAMAAREDWMGVGYDKINQNFKHLKTIQQVRLGIDW